MTRRLKSPESEFVALADRSTEQFAKEFAPLLKAVANRDQAETRRARERIAKAISDTMILSDLMGRRRLFLEYDYIVGSTGNDALEAFHAMFAASPVVPKVTFSEAFADLLTREPRLASSAEEVAELYRTQHAFALAKSAEQSVTRAVQNYIAQTMKQGVPSPSAAQVIRELGDFSRSYANTVYRTNLNTAYTAGRFRQAQEPGVRTSLPAMERYGVTDSSIRQGRRQDGGENHLAANGLLAATNDPIWRTHAPPSGYGCRCGVRMVGIGELRRRGLIGPGGNVLRYEPPGLSGFRAHPRFGQRRPDVAVYAGRLT